MTMLFYILNNYVNPIWPSWSSQVASKPKIIGSISGSGQVYLLSFTKNKLSLTHMFSHTLVFVRIFVHYKILTYMTNLRVSSSRLILGY